MALREPCGKMPELRDFADPAKYVVEVAPVNAELMSPRRKD